MITFISVDLPAPLRPISPTRLPGGDRGGGAVEDRAPAEAHRDCVDVQHGRAPSSQLGQTQDRLVAARHDLDYLDRFFLTGEIDQFAGASAKQGAGKRRRERNPPLGRVGLVEAGDVDLLLGAAQVERTRDPMPTSPSCGCGAICAVDWRLRQ